MRLIRCGGWRLGAGPFIAASALVAAGGLAATYRLAEDLTPAHDGAPHRGWQWVTVGSGTLALLENLALVLGAACVGLVMIWARLGQVSFAWLLLAAGWALAGAFTGMAAQMVSAPAWTASYGRVAIVAVVACWLLVAGFSYVLLRSRDRSSAGEAQCLSGVIVPFLAHSVKPTTSMDEPAPGRRRTGCCRSI